MIDMKKSEIWFVTGSQDLYGQEVIKKIEEHSQIMAKALDSDSVIPCKVVFKAVLKTSDAIRKLFSEANSNDSCAGVITWMHTFSPAKMWIAGLSELRKPLLHLHTQFNCNLPWDSIDMDFMNLNQSAHGDREYGFIGARMKIERKVIVGHWEDSEVRERMGSWMRVAVAFTKGRHLKVVRFGDNMRDVAVTEGDKVEAQIKLGWSVDGYGVGDLVTYMNKVSEEAIDELMSEYEVLYEIAEEAKIDGAPRNSIREQARMEIAMKTFMEEGNFTAFTTNFQDLYGMKQLPGLAAQRLMAAGYGFGAEGDWKTAALVRIMKIMAEGKGTSLMEDYTYHLEKGNEMILGAHMLEICPTLAANRPRIEVHPLSIGGKEDPARLVFDGGEGPAVCASLVDMGGRFRLIVSEVDAVKAEHAMPNLPVARVLWKPQPNLKTAAEAWIHAGGAHHTSFSFNVTPEQLADFAEMAGIECLFINKDTNLTAFRNELRWNDLAFKLR